MHATPIIPHGIPMHAIPITPHDIPITPCMLYPLTPYYTHHPLCFRFHTKKVAQDILNKWVFRTNDCGSHGGNEEGGWHVRRSAYCDPLVPSYTNLPTLEQYVRRQLYAVRRTLLGGNVTDEELDDFVFEVMIISDTVV